MTIKYEASESAKCFSFSNLIGKVKTELKEKHPGISNEILFGLVTKSLSTFKLNGQTFEYSSQDNYLGGNRWYIKCPMCGDKCLKLFLPDNLEGRQPLYACKECHKLKNTSAILGTTSKYLNVIKPLKRLEGLKKQLLKKTMKPWRAQELIEEYERIERSLESSPEYRHWKFQQRFGPTEI